MCIHGVDGGQPTDPAIQIKFDRIAAFTGQLKWLASPHGLPAQGRTGFQDSGIWAIAGGHRRRFLNPWKRKIE
jgi:hypothetical protein